MTSHTVKEGSSFPSERYRKGHDPAYKKLITDLAQHLKKEDVKLIVFNCSLPESLGQSSALNVLRYLDKHAMFSPTNIQPLAKLLKDAYRNDLVHDYVDEFRLKYGRHSSMPASGIQQLPVNRQAYACPSNMREAISQPTLHHLQPSTCAPSKTVHQSSDQMQPGVMRSERQKPRGSIVQARRHSESMPGSVVTTTAHFRQTSMPIHHHTPSHSYHKYAGEYGTATPASASTSSSMFYHNNLVSEQESIHASTDTSQDSGVELVRYKHLSMGLSADTIEPGMSVSQDKEQFEQFWTQPRPRVMSVSTGVQTQGENGSEKTTSPASGSPRTSSSLQRPHDVCHSWCDRVTSVSTGVQTEGEDGSEKIIPPAALNPRVDESENCSGGQDTGKQDTWKQMKNKKGINGSNVLPEKKVENEEPRRQLDQSYNSLPCVEVVGEEEVVVTNKAMTFQWKDYGFKLHVPDNSLPKGVSEYLINIKASLAGQFELPKGYELVSAVYWVRTPGKFKKPVTIEAQHCANFSDTCQLRFVHTSCALPYKFKLIDGGSFSLSSKYGVLSTTHFSGKGIAKKETPGEHSCQYCAQVYFTIKHLQDHWYYCHFVVTKHLEMCLAAVRRKYQQEYDIAPPITFGGDHVALDIPDDGIQTDNGWEIRPNYKPHIKKDRVNSFSAAEDTVVPECVLLLKWNQPEKVLKPLEHKVKLLGTGDEEDFFLMVYHPDTGSQHHVSVSSSSLQTEGTTAVSTTVHQKKPPAVEESSQIELTINDLVDVTKYLVNLGQSDIYYLGLTLGLNHPHLKNMESSRTFKEDMIAAWLQKEDQVTRRGLPTWETLVNALRDDQVKQTGVADKIAIARNLDIVL